MIPPATRKIRALATCLALALPVCAVADPSPSLQVRFQLLDANGSPLAGAPIRLTLAVGQGWQRPEAGFRTVTDNLGEVHWSTAAAPERRRRKWPTNFITQTFSAAQYTSHIAIGTELAYVARPWLVVCAADRFANGASAQLDGLRLYGRDKAGNFSVQATRQADGTWRMPGVPGAFTTPGFNVERFSLEPNADGWSVELAIQRLSEPVRR